MNYLALAGVGAILLYLVITQTNLLNGILGSLFFIP